MTNWADVLIAGLVALPPTVAATVAAVCAIRATRKVEAVHTAVNGRDDKLLNAARKVARAEGHKAGLRAERDRKRVR